MNENQGFVSSIRTAGQYTAVIGRVCKVSPRVNAYPKGILARYGFCVALILVFFMSKIYTYKIRYPSNRCMERAEKHVIVRVIFFLLGWDRELTAHHESSNFDTAVESFELLF